MAAKNISFTGSDQKLDRGRSGNEGGVHPPCNDHHKAWL